VANPGQQGELVGFEAHPWAPTETKPAPGELGADHFGRYI
jgi:hypothetical protein